MIGALIAILLLLGLLVLGVPMLVALLAAVVLNFFLSGQWTLTLPQSMISGVSSFTLIALVLLWARVRSDLASSRLAELEQEALELGLGED